MIRKAAQSGHFIADLVSLGGGTVLGHLTLLAVSPLLTRLISPAEMGVFGTFSTVIAVLSVVASLSYETAIVNASTDEEAIGLIGVVIVMSAIVSIVSMFGLWAVSLAGVEDAIPFWLPPVAAASVVAANAFSAAQLWYVRAARYRLAGLGALALNGGRGLTSLLMAALVGGATALPLADTAARCLGLLVIDRAARIPAALRATRRSPSTALALLRKYHRFALFQMPSNVLEALSVWLPISAAAFVFGPAAAGQMALIQRIFAAPMALVGKSLADVFHQRVSSRPSSMMKTTLAVLAAIAAAAVPGCLVLGLFGEPLFSIVFGAEWAVAGRAAQYLAPLMGLQIAGAIVTRLLIVIGRQDVKLLYMSLTVAGYLLTFLAGYLLNLDFLDAVIGMSVIGGAAYLAWILHSLLLVRNLAAARS